jgi:hypothetical protein
VQEHSLCASQHALFFRKQHGDWLGIKSYWHAYVNASPSFGSQPTFVIMMMMMSMSIHVICSWGARQIFVLPFSSWGQAY